MTNGRANNNIKRKILEEHQSSSTLGYDEAEAKDWAATQTCRAMDSLQKSLGASTSIEDSVIPRRRRALTEGAD
jgi:hypothetical protein